MPRIPLSALVHKLDAASNSAMESRGSPEVTTEEIGSTAEAAVTIERLKQENLDLMEIHALEQDASIIEAEGDAAAELATATQEITELKADLEHYRETGGINMRDATHIQRQIRSLERRMGMKVIDMPALESFRGATEDRIALTVALEESSENFLVKIWNWIKEQWNKLVEKIKSWFGKSKESKKKAEEKVEEAKAEVAKAKNELMIVPQPESKSGSDTKDDDKSSTAVAIVKKTFDAEKILGPNFIQVETADGFVDMIEKQYDETLHFLTVTKDSYAESKKIYSNIKEVIAASKSGHQDVNLGPSIAFTTNVANDKLAEYTKLVFQSSAGDLTRLVVEDGEVLTPYLAGGIRLVVAAKPGKHLYEELSSGLTVSIATGDKAGNLDYKDSVLKSAINKAKVEKSLAQMNTRLSNAESTMAKAEKEFEEISKLYATSKDLTSESFTDEAQKSALDWFKIVATKHIGIKLTTVYTELLKTTVNIAAEYTKLAKANKA